MFVLHLPTYQNSPVQQFKDNTNGGSTTITPPYFSRACKFLGSIIAVEECI